MVVPLQMRMVVFPDVLRSFKKQRQFSLTKLTFLPDEPLPAAAAAVAAVPLLGGRVHDVRPAAGVAQVGQSPRPDPL
jgi:hypothetical protein